MGVRMVHYLVSRVRQRFYSLGLLIDPISDYEEGRADITLAEYLFYMLAVRIIPGGVEADRDLLVVLVLIDAIDGQIPVLV